MLNMESACRISLALPAMHGKIFGGMYDDNKEQGTRKDMIAPEA
jgi:hypothetical protein